MSPLLGRRWCDAVTVGEVQMGDFSPPAARPRLTLAGKSGGQKEKTMSILSQASSGAVVLLTVDAG